MTLFYVILYNKLFSSFQISSSTLADVNVLNYMYVGFLTCGVLCKISVNSQQVRMLLTNAAVVSVLICSSPNDRLMDGKKSWRQYNAVMILWTRKTCYI